ncbi:hypothetical protein FGB62_1g253 [Gracilaria domingensis]|nr:hypothetical protein FGB62_1g253 [Gracilaria domingensis]
MHPAATVPHPCAMSPRDLLLPTAEEAQAIASLALNPDFACYETILSLQGVLDFISHADIFNFLFTEDPVHIRHIAMPDLSSKSIAGNFIKTRVEPGNCSKTSLSCHASGSYLLIPAFTVNQTTYGFGIHTYFDSSSGSTCQGRPPAFRTVESRFVKNDSSGILLKVMDSDQSGLVTVEYSRMSSLTRVARSSATFYRNKFRSILRSGTLDMPRVLSCISEFYTANQYRRCPICTHAHNFCNCTPQLAKPRHPFDTNAFLKNISLRFGRFEGVGDVTCFVNGRDCRKALLGCRFVIDGQLNMSKVEEMRSMVIEKHLSRVNPLNFFVASEAPVQKSNRHASEQEHPHNDILSELLSKQDEQKLSTCKSENDASWLLSPIQSAVEAAFPFNDQDSVLPNDFSLFIPHTADFMQPVQPKNLEQESSDSIFLKVPDALLSPVTPASTSSQSSKDEELLRLQKLEKRKARNRASAMRSHLKKKAFIDGLKQELHRNHDNILHLRSREMMLRKENLRLRKLLPKD